MSDKQIERIERELRSPGPRESVESGRRLPGDVRQARVLLAEIGRASCRERVSVVV